MSGKTNVLRSLRRGESFAVTHRVEESISDFSMKAGGGRSFI